MFSFKLLKRECFLVSSLHCDSEVNIFGSWISPSKYGKKSSYYLLFSPSDGKSGEVSELFSGASPQNSAAAFSETTEADGDLF